MNLKSLPEMVYGSQVCSGACTYPVGRAIVSPRGTQPDHLLGSALRARRRRRTATPCCLSLSSADDEGALQRRLAREGQKSSSRTTRVWDIWSRASCISFLLLQDRFHPLRYPRGSEIQGSMAKLGLVLQILQCCTPNARQAAFSSDA